MGIAFKIEFNVHPTFQAPKFYLLQVHLFQLDPVFWTNLIAYWNRIIYL